MASIATRRVDRMLSAPPMALSNVTQIACKYGKTNECARVFVRDYVPLMAYGNGHLKFHTETTNITGQEYCMVTLGSGRVITLNFKLYRYPLQVLQRILDVAAEP